MGRLDKYKPANHICPYCNKIAGFDEELVEHAYSISNKKKRMIQYFHRNCYLENVRKEKEKWARSLCLK